MARAKRKQARTIFKAERIATLAKRGKIRKKVAEKAKAKAKA